MKVRAKTVQGRTSGEVMTQVDSQVYKAGMVTLGAVACVIGLWSAIAVIGGVVASGGVSALVGNWFKAVFGF